MWFLLIFYLHFKTKRKHVKIAISTRLGSPNSIGGIYEYTTHFVGNFGLVLPSKNLFDYKKMRWLIYFQQSLQHLTFQNRWKFIKNGFERLWKWKKSPLAYVWWYKTRLTRYMLIYDHPVSFCRYPRSQTSLPKPSDASGGDKILSHTPKSNMSFS